MFKETIAELLSKIKEVKEAGLSKQQILEKIEIPPQKEMGDFAFPCFILASKLKKNPSKLANELVEKINKRKPLEIEKIEVNGSYINFFINKKILAENILTEILKEKEYYGRNTIGKGQKIVVDFSGPNIGKPMHIGHIRSTILGDSLLRIFDYEGYDAIGINYFGDIGLHIGKMIVAYELWVDEEALKKDPVKELLRIYIKFCDNEKIEYQEDLEEEFQGNEWTEKAKEKLKLLEIGDKKTEKIWHEIHTFSKKGFDKVYQLLNVNFHETTGQSLFSKKGKEIITEALRKGLAKIEDDGAVYVEFDDTKNKDKTMFSVPQKSNKDFCGLPKKYILRSNGTASYITQDIGAAIERYKKYKFDKMIYVTDFRQELHFKHLFAILKKFGHDFSDKLIHVGFGTVNFGSEIMSTRKGKVILLEEVLAKTIEKAEYEIKKRKTKGDAEKIGVGAIRYAFLRNEPKRDVIFSWENALNFEGNTGPYLQYSYARASSILRKSKKKANVRLKYTPEPQETELIKRLSQFSEVVRIASQQLNPSIIANYSIELAQIFSEFYHSCPVINSEQEEFRLALVEAFRVVMKQSLFLLGIEVMEEM